MNLNILETFQKVIQIPINSIAESAAWGLANIAGDSFKNRRLLIERGTHDLLIQKYQLTKEENLKTQIIWALSNICKNKESTETFDPIINIII